MTLLCKQIIVAESKEVKTGCCLVRSSKEGYGSTRAVLPMMMMMMMSVILFTCKIITSSLPWWDYWIL
jgi:hypothetical protein